MTWTVACFCGNVYTAPPDRCDACGSTLSYEAPGDAPTRDTATAGVPSVLATRRNGRPLLWRAPTSMFDQTPNK
jgi:hypothetical protein